VNLTGVYEISGTFDQGLPGDSISGWLRLRAPSEQSKDPTGAVRFAVKVGGLERSTAGEVADLRITPVGAISFKLESGPEHPGWSFSGFLSGHTITGRHTLARGSKPLHGPWTAELLNPD
jgi:hypothetical protein